MENQDRLFVPFSQVDASSTRKHGGAGLGLAISRSLVRLMEGEIELSSAAGAGAEFRFHVPVRVLENNEGLPRLPARRVAVVSANSRARAHYAALLEIWGLSAATYENITKLPPSGRTTSCSSTWSRGTRRCGRRCSAPTGRRPTARSSASSR
ncbi:ATP-binding protein [Oleiharenicola sp. Vm1]|uniref:ATP-binding protein n=1 Tax=Oleiharenicola sp. Vm1 TaxID=3398393 RepID=UPI0039F55172